jgi:hypothetical protein
MESSVTMAILSSLLGALLVFVIVRPVVRAINRSVDFAGRIAAATWRAPWTAGAPTNWAPWPGPWAPSPGRSRTSWVPMRPWKRRSRTAASTPRATQPVLRRLRHPHPGHQCRPGPLPHAHRQHALAGDHARSLRTNMLHERLCSGFGRNRLHGPGLRGDFFPRGRRQARLRPAQGHSDRGPASAETRATLGGKRWTSATAWCR